MDRRGFLRSSAYFTVASAGGLLAACGGSNDTAPQGSYGFPLGVASGDPKDASIVFWTRCAPKAGNADVELRLEVATDSAFTQVAGVVELKAVPTYDHTVRAKLTGLAPATRYYYRFRAGADLSPVGQAKTAPAANSTPAQMNTAAKT